MNNIFCKRIYEEPSSSDGFRILVDRLWSRGISRDSAYIDHWAKDIAPSSELRKWFSHEPGKFETFSEKYADELNANPAVHEFLSFVSDRLTAGRITLLYSAKDTEHNNAVVLAGWLNRTL